ncbi:uncharacterized protein LOC144102451 [Amblyomma americanum]
MTEPALFSEMYQASLRPHPPDKPLPDETGFMEYPLSPPANPPGYYMPVYYPPPPPRPPPPPPAPMLAPSAPVRTPRPAPYSANTTIRRDRVRTTTDQTTSDRNWSLAACISYIALVLVGLLLFTLAVMLAVVMAGKRFSVRRHTTLEEDGPVVLRTARHEHVGLVLPTSSPIEVGRAYQQIPSVGSTSRRRRRLR